jgi:hypothetical protein
MSKLYVNGIVHSLIDEDKDFKQYLLDCARSIIPNFSDAFELEGRSSYNDKCLKEANDELEKFINLSEKEQLDIAEKTIEEEIMMLRKHVETRTKEQQKLQSIYTQVSKWELPSEDFKGLKESALEGLNAGLNDKNDYIFNEIEKLKSTNFKLWVKNHIDQLNKEVKYYTDQVKKDKKNYDFNVQWVKDLKASLGE